MELQTTSSNNDFLLEINNTYLNEEEDGSYSIQSIIGFTQSFEDIHKALNFALQLQPGLTKTNLQEPDSNTTHIARDYITISSSNILILLKQIETWIPYNNYLIEHYIDNNITSYNVPYKYNAIEKTLDLLYNIQQNEWINIYINKEHTQELLIHIEYKNLM